MTRKDVVDETLLLLLWLLKAVDERFYGYIMLAGTDWWCEHLCVYGAIMCACVGFRLPEGMKML